MLALVLACSISAGGVRAQTYLSNTEYNFRIQQAVDGQGFTPTGGLPNGDPTPVLSMSCLAANGYGQWTINETPGQGSWPSVAPTTFGADEYPAGWYLLANGLYQPSVGFISGDATHPQCIPPGVVQCGPLSQPIPTITGGLQAKAVTNLDGMVDFIWVNWVKVGLVDVGDGFVQSGFTAADVDLSLSFLSNPEPGSTPGAGTMNILPDPTTGISATPHIWPTIPVGVNTVTSYGGPGDWRNEFDVCADASFIYIIWETIPVIPAVEQLWVTVVPIGSGTPVGTFPIQIPAGTDNCMNPTITCDPRNNRGGGTTPAFDIAYIDQTTEKIMVASWSGTGWTTTPTALSTSYWNPNITLTPLTYATPMEARIVRNSINMYGGSSSSLAVYAEVCNVETKITGDGYDGWLIFYPPTNIFGTANYVAGARMFMPPPISGSFPVKANCITAFADPYDNQAGWQSLDEFHCLFQYDLGKSVASNENWPLCIARGSDVGANYPAQPDGTMNSTILVLNQTSGGALGDNPAGEAGGDGTINAEYVAAVNQMGIHVHWRSQLGGAGHWSHFYARDMNRTFDEPIDENTLVTDQCYVTDGSSTGSNHGGTVGASIATPSTFEAINRMTVWSDPNYGPPSLDGSFGLYSPPPPGTLTTLSPYVGTLNFAGSSGNPNGTNVVLNVGDDLLHSDYDFGFYTGATLAVMPYFFFNFVAGQNQGVTVNYLSTFDYFGLNATHNTSGVQTGIGTPFTDGTTDGYGAGTISLESGSGEYGHYSLNVHGGSDFYTGGGNQMLSGSNPGGALISNDGVINVLYEPGIYPVVSALGTSYVAATGHMTLLGQTSLTDGYVYGNIPYVASDQVYNPTLGISLPAFSRRVIMTVDYGFNSLGSGVPQFLATDVNFENSDNKGTSELDFGHADRIGNTTPSFEWSEFDGCSCSAIEIHGMDPNDFYSKLYIQNGCDFENIRNKCIFIENDQNPITAWYGIIGITGNTFGVFAPDVDDVTVSDEVVGTSFISAPYGIYLKNFDDNATGHWEEGILQYTPPVISDNQFTYSGNFHADLNASSAADRAQWGTGSSAIGLENTTALVESNTISDNGYSAGIGMRSSPLGSAPLIYSVICGNTISGLTYDTAFDIPDEIGISANWGAGLTGPSIISLNTITDCDCGIDCFFKDNSFLLYNSVTACSEQELDINTNSTGHLSGNPRLSGAFNSLSGETYDPIESEGVSVITIEGNGMDLEQGKNNIYYTGPDPLNSGVPLLISAYNNYVNLGDVDGNWWGPNIDPHYEYSPPYPSEYLYWNTTGNGELDAGGYETDGEITYSATSGGVRSDSSSIPTDASCPDAATYNSDKVKKTDIKPMSVPDDTENCDSLRFKIWNYTGPGQTQLCYDTAMKFIETCYDNSWAPSMFQYYSGALQSLAGTDTSLWVDGRKWLESVLYLNTTNPEYFCACVEAIAGTFNSASDTSEQLYWKDLSRNLSVDQWLVNNTTCDTPFIQNGIYGAIASEYSSWLNNPTTPLDTTIPPLDSVNPDLYALLEKHLLYASVSNPPQPGIITNATANPNPANSGTVISFSIAKEAYVKIALYDVLGKEASSYGYESLFEPGNKSVSFSLQGLPSGTYYARIITAYGEVQTVKLVKE